MDDLGLFSVALQSEGSTYDRSNYKLIKKHTAMFTLNMTFEVPESKSIDIEALKKQMNGFFNLLLSMPSIMKQDHEENCWEASPELLARLETARQEVRDGNCTTIHSKEELDNYFESL